MLPGCMLRLISRAEMEFATSAEGRDLTGILSVAFEEAA